MYDFDNYKAKKFDQNFSEKEFAQKEEVKNVTSLLLMKAEVEVYEDYYVVIEDLTWTVHMSHVDNKDYN